MRRSVMASAIEGRTMLMLIAHPELPHPELVEGRETKDAQNSCQLRMWRSVMASAVEGRTMRVHELR
jgi:hypothetical protein